MSAGDESREEITRVQGKRASIARRSTIPIANFYRTSVEDSRR